MASDSNLQLQLSIEADASIQRAARELDGVADSASNLEDTLGDVASVSDKVQKSLSDLERKSNFNQIARDAAKLASETNDVASATKDLVRQLESVGATDREIEQVVKQYQKLRREINDSANAQERFDRTSQDVGLLGDFGSAANTVAGIPGFGAAADIGFIAELGEAIPRLKAAAAGAPQALASAAAALGPAGLLVAGVAAGAAALVAIYKNSIKEQEQALQSLAAASASFVDFAASGGTSEDARREIDERVQFIEFANKEILRLEQEYQESRFNLLDRFINSGEQAITDQIKEFKSEISNAEGEISRFTSGLQNNELATNDAAAAQEKSAQSVTSAAQAFEQAARAVDSETRKVKEADTAFNQLGQTTGNLAKSATTAAAGIAQATRTISEPIRRKASGGFSVPGLRNNPLTLGGNRGGGAQDATRARLQALVDANPNATFEDGSLIRNSAVLTGSRGGAVDSANQTNNDLQRAYEERRQLVLDYNERETEIRRQSIFDQKQALERFRFDERKLLEQGSFSAAFEARRDLAFENQQTGDRLRFEAQGRRSELDQQLTNLAQEVRNSVTRVEVSPSPLFNTSVQRVSQATASRTVNNTSGRILFGG